MPLEPCSVASISVTIAVSALAGAAVNHQATNDIIALAGAMPTTLFVAYDARRKDRSGWYLVSVVLSSMFFGGAGPGALVYLFWPELWLVLPWQVWLLMGMACGLVAWAFIHAIYKFVTGNPVEILKAILRKLFGNWLGEKTDKSDK